MKNIITLFVLLMLCGPVMAAKTVSDSLVKDLSCNNLTAKEIYRRMDTSQFSALYHNSMINWPFSAGMYDIAACWSLSRTQRLFFYLSRWNNPQAQESEAKTQGLLDMIRGSTPYAAPGESKIKELPLKGYKVFANQESHLITNQGIFGDLLEGIHQYFPTQNIVRNFKSEIEHYQKERFHKFMKNVKYVIGTGARSERKNRQTRDQLISNLSQNRLTLVIIRPTRTTQHVVLVKRYEKLSNGDIEFWVYDSNQPNRDQRILYKAAEDDFFAPEIIWGFVSSKKSNEPIGLYITDEEDRNTIDEALLSYYSRLCKAP